MERLTNKSWGNLDPWECCGQDYYCKRGCHDEGGCANGCIVPRLYRRLARYEDLGLMPEEIHELLHNTAGPLHKKLGQWIDAEKQGRLVALPEPTPDIDFMRILNLVMADAKDRVIVLLCKVGDTCYVAGNDGVRIVECKINYITLSDDGIEYVLDSVCGENCDGCPFEDDHQDLDGEYYCSCEHGDVSISASEFGKTVFLTREEAEAALKGRNDG